MSSTPDKIKEHIPPAGELKQDVKEAAKEATNDLIHSARAFVAGGVGGVCAVLTGHPFDLVKVHLQTAEKGAYNGAMDVVRKIMARSGPGGLYAGVTAPLYGVTPMCMCLWKLFLFLCRETWLTDCGGCIVAISFWGYDLGKNLVRRVSDVSSADQFTTGQIAAAGAFSAVPMTIVTAPMERVKVLLQIQGQKQKAGEKPKYAGSFDCAKQLYKEGGIRSVYRGTFMTLARDGPGSAAYFAAYEVVKKKLTPKDPVTGLPGTLSLPAVMATEHARQSYHWRRDTAAVQGRRSKGFLPRYGTGHSKSCAGECCDISGSRVGAAGHGQVFGLRPSDRSVVFGVLYRAAEHYCRNIPFAVAKRHALMPVRIIALAFGTLSLLPLGACVAALISCLLAVVGSECGIAEDVLIRTCIV